MNNNNPTNVLVVDDEESIRKILRARLEREHFIVHTAENADQALANLAHDPQISLIITDIRMPGKTGIELLKEIKLMHPGKKVIVMTGHAEKSTAIEALKNNASDYLEKPFNMEEMVLSLKRAEYEYQLEQKAKRPLSLVPTNENLHPNQPQNVIPLFSSQSAVLATTGGSGQTFAQMKKECVDQFEQNYLQNILTQFNGNVTAAAKAAGLDRSNFLRLLRRHHITSKVYRRAA